MKSKLLFAILLLCTVIVNAQFTDDFEGYTLGSMGAQDIDIWNTWSGVPTTGEAILVTDRYANSGTQAGYIGNGGGQDAILLFDNVDAGLWTVSFMAYVPTDSMGYFNAQGPITAAGAGSGAWVTTDIYFNKDNGTPGVGELDSLTFDFPHDAWFKVRVDFDVDNKTYLLEVNGVWVTTVGMPFGTSGGATIAVVGGLDLFSAGATNAMYVDDIEFDVTVGINQARAAHNAQNLLSVYPNPASDLVTIETDARGEIRVVNMLGKVVLRSEFTNTIDVSNLTSGVYYVNCGNATQKLVIR